MKYVLSVILIFLLCSSLPVCGQEPAQFDSLLSSAKQQEEQIDYRNAYLLYKQCFALDSTRRELLVSLARTAAQLGRADDTEMSLLEEAERTRSLSDTCVQ